MKKLGSILGVLFAILFIFSSTLLAQHSHGGMSMGTPMKMDTKEVLVEGVKATFQIMANDEHRKMLKDMKMKEDIEPGTTHVIDVTLKDEKTQKEIIDAQRHQGGLPRPQVLHAGQLAGHHGRGLRGVAPLLR